MTTKQSDRLTKGLYFFAGMTLIAFKLTLVFAALSLRQ